LRVIAALLGHATLDTVMVVAKLYLTTLVESYRDAMRGIYTDVHGADALRTPTVEEWALQRQLLDAGHGRPPVRPADR
jgi:hypothetical protein